MIDQVFANFSFIYVFLFLFLSFCLYCYYIVVRNDREINALGARAPIINSYVPFGKAQFSNPFNCISTILALLISSIAKACPPPQASPSSTAPSEQL